MNKIGFFGDLWYLKDELEVWNHFKQVRCGSHHVSGQKSININALLFNTPLPAHVHSPTAPTILITTHGTITGLMGASFSRQTLYQRQLVPKRLIKIGTVWHYVNDASLSVSGVNWYLDWAGHRKHQYRCIGQVCLYRLIIWAYSKSGRRDQLTSCIIQRSIVRR
jgi:hypothetical protein